MSAYGQHTTGTDKTASWQCYQRAPHALTTVEVVARKVVATVAPAATTNVPNDGGGACCIARRWGCCAPPAAAMHATTCYHTQGVTRVCRRRANITLVIWMRAAPDSGPHTACGA